MRTVHECALEDMFPDKQAKRYILEDSQKCSKENPFIMVKQHRHKL